MYDRKTVGHVIQALRNLGFTEIVTGQVQIGDGEVTLGDRLFARYRYFDGIEQPLFRFTHDAVAGSHPGPMRHTWVRDENNVLRPRFRLGLSVHDTPSLEVYGVDATAELHRYIGRVMLTQWSDRETYRLSQAAGAFFQGGSEDENGECIYIEFWKPAGAEAWVDYLNSTYESVNL